MKVWLDDVREAPQGWDLVTNYSDCVALLATGKVCYLSLDHDLGTTETGYNVATWIERKVWEDGFYPPVIEIHSANPVGRKNIEAAIASIKRGRGSA